MNRLEAIRQRLGAATPGPWEAHHGHSHGTAADAQLIAHAPEDIALLLEVAEAGVLARDLDDHRYSSDAASFPWLPFWIALGNLTEEVTE